MWQFTVFALVLAVFASSAQSANILAYFMAPSISHQVTYQAIIRELAQRGHKLTVFTSDPINDPSLKTLDEVDLHDLSYGIWNKYNISSMGAKDNDKGSDISPLINAYIEIFDQQMKHPRMQEIVHNSSKYQFDLLLSEYPVIFAGPLKKIFNCSMIGITSLPLHMNGNVYVGNPSHPVLYPDINLPYSNKLTFRQKVHSFVNSNLASWFLEKYKKVFYDIIAEHYGNEIIDQMEVLIKDFDMVFVNHNPILYVPRPNVPAVIEFHGIHIKPPKELPTDIKSLLDNATQGAVYVSFGSNIKSSALPLAKRRLILEAMAELPYQFLWKFEHPLEDLPQNVQIMKWVPQQDVLRHPNIKLFVTQGGIQSLDEAMYTKTPVLVIPFFGDQLGNALKAQEARVGKSLSFATLTKDEFKSTIVEIINDEKYNLRMEEVYDILTDQPMTALEKTVWWIEYTLRHKGAGHLRCPSVDSTTVEYYMLDVIGFLLGIILFAIFSFCVVVALFVKFVKFVSRQAQQKIKTN